MKEAEVITVASADAVQTAMSPEINLLVLHEGMEGGAIECLRQVRRKYTGPVLYCAQDAHDATFLGELQRLRVSAIFQQPVDADELVRRAAIELAVKVPASGQEAVAAAPTASNPIPPVLLAVWKKHEATNQTRVATLFEACDIGLSKLTDEEVEIAQRAAHQLAGTLGTFGLVQATLLAREAESLLRVAHEASEAQQTRLRQITRTLEMQIADPSLQLPPAESTGDKGDVLFLTSKNETTDQWFEGVAAAGWTPLATADAAGARKLFAMESPAALVVDLTGEQRAEGLVLLQEAANRDCRVIAILPPVGVTRADIGQARALPSQITVPQLIEALEAPQEEEQQTFEGARPKILAVDDDPIVLETITAMLSTFDVDVITINNPLAFWDTLQTVKPDMLILDVDLPLLSGIEICRAVRSDPGYRRIPVIFLSAYSDGDTVHRVFQAGGDDYVYKPVVGPELRTRVANRLLRTRAIGGTTSPAFPKSIPLSKTITVVIPDEGGAVSVISALVDAGFSVERYRETGEDLIRILTGAVEKRPKLILLGEDDSLEILARLDALGVTASSLIWVRAPFWEEAAVEVFERGGAGFIPDGVSLARLVRRMERCLPAIN